MQFPCFLTYVIQRAVFENRFQDCVCDFQRKFYTVHFVVALCKQSTLTFQITDLKSPKCVNMYRSSAYSVDYLF